MALFDGRDAAGMDLITEATLRARLWHRVLRG
jgi:hypothetical protein